MSNDSEAMKKRLEAINRKLQYKDLIDLGGRVSEFIFFHLIVFIVNLICFAYF